MPSPTSPLVPLLVVSTNLRGTLLPVMDVLLRMQEVTSEWSPLIDRRTLCYLVRHAQVLGAGTTPDETWNHETLFYPPIEGEKGTRRIAGFPGPVEHIGFDIDGQPLWQHLLQANWSFYCARVPRRASDRFYAEPAPTWLPNLLQDAKMPHRALWIVRDPRSELAELWMSGRRRGALPAVVNCIDTPLSVAERQANAPNRDRLAELAKLQTTPGHLCLRYEDFVERTADTWGRLRGWLELESSPPPKAPTTGHEWTAARWRPLLPDTVIDHYRQRMGTQMEAHGYPS